MPSRVRGKEVPQFFAAGGKAFVVDFRYITARWWRGAGEKVFHVGIDPKREPYGDVFTT